MKLTIPINNKDKPNPEASHFPSSDHFIKKFVCYPIFTRFLPDFLTSKA
jgi:hypothetical protein